MKEEEESVMTLGIREQKRANMFRGFGQEKFVGEADIKIDRVGS